MHNDSENTTHFPDLLDRLVIYPEFDLDAAPVNEHILIWEDLEDDEPYVLSTGHKDQNGVWHYFPCPWDGNKLSGVVVAWAHIPYIQKKCDHCGKIGCHWLLHG